MSCHGAIRYFELVFRFLETSGRFCCGLPAMLSAEFLDYRSWHRICWHKLIQRDALGEFNQVSSSIKENGKTLPPNVTFEVNSNIGGMEVL